MNRNKLTSRVQPQYLYEVGESFDGCGAGPDLPYTVGGIRVKHVNKEILQLKKVLNTVRRSTKAADCIH